MVLPLARRTKYVNRVNIRKMLQDIVEGLALVIGLLLVNLDGNVPEPLRRLLRQRVHIPDHHIRTAQIPATAMPQIRVESPVAAYHTVGALQKIERIFLFRKLTVSNYNRCSHNYFFLTMLNPCLTGRITVSTLSSPAVRSLNLTIP